jgi:AcrR family transcriptional regulator
VTLRAGTRRPYSSTVRAGQRQGTRERIVRAARALFLRRGYAGTTVEAIATRAGVSPQTIYNVVGGKAEVLKAVYDVMLAGDGAPVPMAQRPSARAVMAAPDARTCLALYARMGREIFERVGPLVPIVLAEGAAGDRAVRRFLDTVEAERARGTAAIATHVAERFGLRPGLGVAEAGDILWTLTSPDVVHRLVRRRRWTLDRFEAWLGTTMADALLGP